MYFIFGLSIWNITIKNHPCSTHRLFLVASSFSNLCLPSLLTFLFIYTEVGQNSELFTQVNPVKHASNLQALRVSFYLLRIDMADIGLRRHTIKSHGLTVARFHIHDWIIFLVLVAIDAGLNVIEPFHRFVGEDMSDLKYPFKDNTIPFWAVPIIAVLLPLAIFFGVYYKRKDVYDLHHATLGLFYSVLITGVITDAIKDAVGRPRPNFYWRCFPKGNATFDSLGNVICYGNKSDIKEGHKSFPSGHSSWSFAGLAFLSWYLAGKIKAFNRDGHIFKLCIVFAPLLIASLVAISRVDDYWHHWQDVFAGGLLGLTVASFCYLQFFPAPNDVNGWCPHAFVTHVVQGKFPSLGSQNNELALITTEDGRRQEQRVGPSRSDDIEEAQA